MYINPYILFWLWLAGVAVRISWSPEDPEIVSDVLFAVANVMSIARTTYIMPAFEVLGPLQISLGRMLGDITRFLVLFTLVSTTSSYPAHGQKGFDMFHRRPPPRHVSRKQEGLQQITKNAANNVRRLLVFMS